MKEVIFMPTISSFPDLVSELEVAALPLGFVVSDARNHELEAENFVLKFGFKSLTMEFKTF
jgi:hypothetical protein